MAERHGVRNAQVTVIAPTGTIGLVMDCDTTGIEPDFALVKFKKLAGGGYFKIINRMAPTALATLGYTVEQIEDDQPLRGRPRHAGRCAGARPCGAGGQGLHRRGAGQARGDAADRVRHQVRDQPVHAGRRVLEGAARAVRQPDRGPGPRRAAGDRLLARRDRGREHLLLRGHDRRGRAAPAGRASLGVRLRQSLRPQGQALSCRSPATSR